MAMRGAPRVTVGSTAWVAEERDSARTIAHSEIEEFSFAARNEMDWLNEHMAEIFSENQMNVAELFKTPGKLRGKTPRTARKANHTENRVPLGDVFSATPKGAANPFAIAGLDQTRSPMFRVAEDAPERPVSQATSPTRAPVAAAKPVAPAPPAPIAFADSGYHGSQETFDDDMLDQDQDVDMIAPPSPHDHVQANDFAAPPAPRRLPDLPSPTVVSAAEETFESAREEPTRTAYVTAKMATPPSPSLGAHTSPAAVRSPSPARTPRSPSPKRNIPQNTSSPLKSSPLKQVHMGPQRGFPSPLKELNMTADASEDDEARSPSVASSPIAAPFVRKNSLQFPSLPAREPLANKSQGRVSRISHLEQARSSYYNRQTGGKSLGGAIRRDSVDEEDQDNMDIDDEDTALPKEDATVTISAHSKTYTQRLQDRISMLGKAQPPAHRPSKSIANLLPSQMPATASQAQPSPLGPAFEPVVEAPKPSPPQPKNSVSAPGAFPDDDEEDDWIAPPKKTAPVAASPRPELAKSFSAPVFDSSPRKETPRRETPRRETPRRETPGASEFVRPKSRTGSPLKSPFVPGRSSSAKGHAKSSSVPYFPTIGSITEDGAPLVKTISVSNPTLAPVAEDGASVTPSKWSRGFRDSPLKQVKKKISSLLQTSKDLLASSAAISADGKNSMLGSPSHSRLGFHAGPSVDSFRTADNVAYPDLSHHGGPTSRPVSPARTNSTRRTRASTEREKKETKEKEKEQKEALKQMEKLEKARSKEAEKARVFTKEQEKVAAMEAEKARIFAKEQERVAAMEKQVAAQRAQEALEKEQLAAQKAQERELAAQKAQERELAAQKAQEREMAAQRAQEQAAQRQPRELKTPGPVSKKSVPGSPTRPPTRTSPRKTKAQMEAEGRAATNPSSELDMDMVDAPASTMPRPSVQRPGFGSVSRPQTLKRPMKPSTQPLVKSKQAPTVIRVNTTSSQQSQFHTTNSALSANLHETLGQQPQPPARQLNTKTSQPKLQGKSSVTSLKGSQSSNGPGRPKALDMAAKRREQEERDAQRKRETKLENDRKRAAQEEERKQEEQRREEERKREAKKAAIEKAKQTKAPPPASRSQPNGPPDYNLTDKGPARPVSRLAQQDGRMTIGKGPAKRPLQQEAADEPQRPQGQRNMPSYHPKDAKRIRMSEEFDEDIDMADPQPNIKGPPIRPSTGLKKEHPNKSMYGNGYATLPSQANGQSLHKSTVTSQLHGQMKTGNPLDMAQVSKGPILFKPNPNAPGQTQKTPARPAPTGKMAKSAARSSPRVPNGDAIDLPEINTDDEDSDSDDGHVAIAPWADSPALKSALMAQEVIDPMQIFGPPRPINMEEVFKGSKDRFSKFRARTSSANWSGADKLTEEDVRKDLQAQAKMRMEGGWSYEIGRDVA
ncbi:inner centromere protein-related protein pic1 [Podospora conica]|nr:inner centromere protein-related protein pic1 [Schizothecium conicum]